MIMDPTKATRPFLLAFIAAVGVLVLNIALRLMLKFEGMGVTMAIAFGVGGLVATWFFKKTERAPTEEERRRFLWSYAGFIVIPYLLFFAIGAVRAGSVNLASLFILFLHSIAYPAAAQLFLSEKYFNSVIARGKN